MDDLQPDPLADSVDPSNDSHREQSESPPQVDVIPQVPPPIEHKAQATHCKPDQTPLWKIVLETGAVAVGIVVASIYYGQLKEMQKATTASTKAADAAKSAAETAASQLELAQRPWVSITPNQITGLSGDVNALNISVKVTLRNSGPTPAVKWDTDARLFPFTGNPQDMQQIKQRVCRSAVEVSVTSEKILIPGAPPVEQIVTTNMSRELLAKSTSKHGYLFIQFVLCAAYKSAFDESKQYTAFGGVFDVKRIGPGGVPFGINLSKDIPLHQPIATPSAFILVEE
jgi:hypothetical protein